MLIDLKLDGKTVMVIGGGKEANRKVQSFLGCGAKIWVISKEFSGGIQNLAEEKQVALLKTEIQNVQAFVASLNPKPNVLLAVTDNPRLNAELVEAAKKVGSLAYSVDNAALNDFTLPAIAKVGDVKVAVSTGGKSPAMARELRQRIEKLVTPEDLLEIELQSKMRDILKKQVADSKERGKLLYEILNNNKIKHALKQGNLVEAQELAIKLINKTETEK